MREDIKIPSMGESVTEATIGSLLKPSGASVQENEEIIELETEKVNQVLYAPISGILSWSIQEGDTVTIGAVIGHVDSEGKGRVEKPKEKPEIKPPEEKKETLEKPPQKIRLGQKEFLEEIQKPSEEIKQTEQKKPASPVKKEEGRETRRQMTKIRKVIASRLVDALHNAAMLTTFNEVDMSSVIELRTKYKDSFAEKHGVKLGFMSFFVKAVVEGLKTFPDFNSYIDGDEIVHREYYDIGIAVGTEKGLFVPVLRDCEKMSFAEIEKRIVEFAKKAKQKALSLDDLKGGGFTITNGGVYGSLLSTPIINPPQVAILGMHKIEKRPVVVNDQIVIRPMMYLALSYDHRIVDGKDAVSFLVMIKEVLEDPARLMFFEREG